VQSAFADLVSAQARESQLAHARDRLYELTQLLAYRESAGESAGYDRLRADREVMDLEAELSATHADRARAQALIAGFLALSDEGSSLVAAVPPASPKAPLPSVDELVSRAQTLLGEPAALREEIESAKFAERAAERRLIPEPEIVAGTKSSTFAGGDVGSVLSVHVTVPVFDRSKAERAAAQARLTQAEARSAAFQHALRAQLSSLRAIVIERREAAERYRTTRTASTGQLERIAQISYEAGERGILELLDAYRNSAAAGTRQAALDAAARQAEIDLELASGWEAR
jgi:cobalt-zinc-cadmium efflux system outer membrane protein